MALYSLWSEIGEASSLRLQFCSYSGGKGTFMLDTRQLQALDAIARHGSVAKAARALGWSQPTVDHHLGNLDRAVGSQLTIRDTRGTRLTHAGELMAERAAEILALSESALRDTRDLARLGRSRLKLGIFPTAAARLLPSIVRNAELLGFEIEPTLEESPDLIQHIKRRDLDAAIIYAVEGYPLALGPRALRIPLYKDELLLAVPTDHWAAERTVIRADDLVPLARERWALGTKEGDPMDQVVMDVFAGAGLQLNISTLRTDDLPSLLGLVGAGLAVGLIPHLAEHMVNDDVALVPFEDVRFARHLELVAPWASGRTGHAAKRLEAAVRGAIAEVEE